MREEVGGEAGVRKEKAKERKRREEREENRSIKLSKPIYPAHCHIENIRSSSRLYFCSSSYVPTLHRCNAAMDSAWRCINIKFISNGKGGVARDVRRQRGEMKEERGERRKDRRKRKRAEEKKIILLSMSQTFFLFRCFHCHSHSHS